MIISTNNFGTAAKDATRNSSHETRIDPSRRDPYFVLERPILRVFGVVRTGPGNEIWIDFGGWRFW